MSATPVINNLYEAKAPLEMTRGEKFDELKTFSTITNALAKQEKLMLHGIRYRPNYKIAIAESFPKISGEHLRPQPINALHAPIFKNFRDLEETLVTKLKNVV
jgi:hypothetical protein